MIGLGFIKLMLADSDLGQSIMLYRRAWLFYAFEEMACLVHLIFL